MIEARRAINYFRPFIGLFSIIAIFFVYDLYLTGGLDTFGLVFGWYNMRLVATQTAIVAVGALGMTFVIISGGIDLSPGSTMALVTVVIALCLNGVTLPFLDEPVAFTPILAVAAGALTGTCIGWMNGFLITKLRVVPFIVTLGMMSMARGLAELVSGQQKIDARAATPDWISKLLYVDSANDFQLPTGVILLFVLALITWMVLEYTVFGRYVFAIGSNEDTATLSGVRVRRNKIWIYTICGFFVSLAALLQFSQGSNGNPGSGTAKELDFIAAVVIGGGSLSGGKGTVLGTLIGAFVIGFLRNACVIYQIPNPVEKIVIGVIIIAAAGIDMLQQRRTTS